MLSAGWTITSWNLEREDSVLKYRHDQININVLAKRISIGNSLVIQKYSDILMLHKGRVVRRLVGPIPIT